MEQIMNYSIKTVSAFLKAIAPTLLLLFLTTNFVLAQNKNQLAFDTDNQRKFDYYFYDALNAKAQGKFAEAFDLFQHCHALDSTNANVLSELSSFYNVLQEKSTAANYLSKAVEKDPDNYYYNMMLASLYGELDRKEDAIGIYTTLLDKDPQNTDVYMALAEAYNNNGDLEKAIETLDALEKNVGIREAITLNKFRLYSMLSKKEKAFEEIETIIK
ncbi:MAG: tetratricopeptide repeat protein, partial [Dysgonamonadaceae bacterium]|nr:tetratricopeptide repeat protein [Dysgonamonadaceae bacterium]